MKFTRFAIFTTILVFIFSFLTFAQDKTPYMFYKVDEKDSTTATIDTGYVVVNGVLLRPPLYMELKNDTIWINQVAAFPALDYPEDFRSNLLYPSPVKLDSSQKQLVADIKSKYKEYDEEFGEDKAKEMIISEYKSNPLLSSITLYEDEGIISFTVAFLNDTHIGVTVKLDMSKVKEVVSSYPGTVPPDTIKARNRQWVEQQFHGFQKDFRRGAMLFLARGSISGADPKGVLETVAKMKRGEISQKEGIEQLRQYRCSPYEAIMIIENIDSW